MAGVFLTFLPPPCGEGQDAKRPGWGTLKLQRAIETITYPTLTVAPPVRLHASAEGQI